MKRFFLSAALCPYEVLAVCGANPTWTASAPAEGTFFLYNVGADAFVYGSHDWGTRASLTARGGIPMTLVGAGSGRYYISTSAVYSSDMYFSSDGSEIYMDQGRTTTWRFVEVEGEADTYLLLCTRDANSRYLVASASDATKDRGNTAIIYGEIDITATVAEDGVLEFGLQTNDNCNFNWQAVKTVRLAYDPQTALHATPAETQDTPHGQLYDLLGRHSTNHNKGLYVTTSGRKIQVK